MTLNLAASVSVDRRNPNLQTHINMKYLMVGYRKEDHDGRITGKGRKAMGRKGIGKLSLFSIANNIEIRTVKNGQKNAFLLDVIDIKNKI